uniref:ATP synthase F0 subunit 6 n=1 Tax=Heterophrynus longicornis TaxID=1046789 RepID=UPI0024115C61|nr:ATP synthase F0 subunit 6 [Heterophrynus longicornis]WEM34674.1 ATP synthase subunit 6 [Heterophrynus longicornis]
MMSPSLFSIFDPSTPPLLNMNWLSSLIPIVIIPSSFWLTSSKFSLIHKFLIILAHKEFKPAMATSFKKGTSLILVSLMMFILINNSMGLLPFIFTTTSHLLLCLLLALPFWLSFMAYGWFNNSVSMFSHLIPTGTPMFLSVFMVFVETISNLIRPITLSVRLTANMIAGHLILTLLSSTFSMESMSPLFLIPFIPEILLISLEMAVAIIQAYVFTILICLYSTEIH